MDYALFLSALALGLAGSPHCTAMCGAACTAVVGRGPAPVQVVFQVARLLSYAALGALVASSVAALSWLGQWSPALRPLWTLVHGAALALGLWLLVRGRQPDWLQNLSRAAPLRTTEQAIRIVPRAALLRAGAAGGLWAAWPCGLLQSALVVAALANGPAAGGLVMAGFAATSSLGLLAAPWVWRRLGQGARAAAAVTWATRAAGALLAAGSAWALGQGLWAQYLAYCQT